MFERSKTVRGKQGRRPKCTLLEVRPVGALRVQKLDVSFNLLLVPAHGEHQNYRVIGALDTSVGFGVVGADGDFVDA